MGRTEAGQRRREQVWITGKKVEPHCKPPAVDTHPEHPWDHPVSCVCQCGCCWSNTGLGYLMAVAIFIDPL